MVKYIFRIKRFYLKLYKNKLGDLGVRNYELGNDFNYLLIKSNEVIENIKTKNYYHTVRPDGSYEILDPNGYKFVIMPNDKDISVVI